MQKSFSQRLQPTQNTTTNIPNDPEHDLPKLQSLNIPIIKVPSSSSHINDQQLQNQHNDIARITQIQNKKLKLINKNLRIKLSHFQKKLDQTHQNNTINNKKAKQKSEKVSTMELQNATKQLQIYKHQLSLLKKNQQQYSNQKIQNLRTQFQTITKQNQQLLQQIKKLKKINRYYNKNISQVTNFNYHKFIQQYNHVKQQNQKLVNKNNQNNSLQNKSSKLAFTPQKNKTNSPNQSPFKKSQQPPQFPSLKQKTQKDNKTITYLLSQNKKIKQHNINLTLTIKQKIRYINNLNQRLNLLHHYQLNHKQHLQLSSDLSQANHDNNICQNIQQELIEQQQPKTISTLLPKYPKIMEAGIKKQDSVKWNHHHFNSKIKEVHIYSQPNGPIKQVNFKYEKGSPKPQNSGKYNKFCCDQKVQQYIRSIKIGFKNSLLQYLTITTSKGRIGYLGKHNLEPQCDTFIFGNKEYEYPAAFFGENEANGVNRIGCIIEYDKKTQVTDIVQFNG